MSKIEQDILKKIYSRVMQVPAGHASTALPPTVAHCAPLPSAQLHLLQVRWQKPPCHCAASALCMNDMSHFAYLRSSWQV